MASADRRLLEMGDVYRLSGWRKFAAIVVPSTLPYLVAGMRSDSGWRSRCPWSPRSSA
jgi:ABC-type nitrate/sulfonate/bicarbonate transport system permease component